jgi:subtilisin family serine protease
MEPLELVKLIPLMQRSGGTAQLKVALIDGPVAMDHPDLSGQNIQQVTGAHSATCSMASSVACMHGTFVAGILSAKRGAGAPAICPACTLLVRPIFPEAAVANGDMPSAQPEELASAIVETVNAGARVINLSAALSQPSRKGESQLTEALTYAARRNVIVVAAAGNQGTVGSSVITRHPWVVPVAGCDLEGKLIPESNLGNSIGRNGVLAPGKNITSLGTSGNPHTSGGTSAAAPFVTGTIGLLWSEFPSASASAIKLAIAGANRPSRRVVAPPLLDAWAAYQALGSVSSGRKPS